MEHSIHIFELPMENLKSCVCVFRGCLRRLHPQKSDFHFRIYNKSKAVTSRNRKRRAPENGNDPFNLFFFNIRKQSKYEKP